MSDDAAHRAFQDLVKKRVPHVIDRDRVASIVKQTISGQDDTIDLIVEQVRNGFASNPRRREGPIGVFMLLGPPGTGKTSLGRALAEAIIPNENGFYTVDMNSCRNEHAAWTYFGSAQGYAGGRGMLTSAIASRRGAPMLILLDEFEKANSAVHRMFLSAWATGFIVENRDATQIDTRNTVWILTSNAATREVQDLKRSAGRDRDLFNEEVRSVLLSSPQSQEPLFAPEVLSRVNEFFCLEPLVFTEDNREGTTIGFNLIRNLLGRLASEYDLNLEDEDITPEALAGILHMLTTPFAQGGIRALRVWLKRQLASKMVDFALSGVTRVGLDVAPSTFPGTVRLKIEAK